MSKNLLKLGVLAVVVAAGIVLPRVAEAQTVRAKRCAGGVADGGAGNSGARPDR